MCSELDWLVDTLQATVVQANKSFDIQNLYNYKQYITSNRIN